MNTIKIPDDPRVIRNVLRVNRVKILKCLMELEIKLGEKAYQEYHNPGPYLSLIHEQCGLSKRTTLVNLNDLENEGLLTSVVLRCELEGRKKIVRVFRLNPKIDFSWLSGINL